MFIPFLKNVSQMGIIYPEVGIRALKIFETTADWDLNWSNGSESNMDLRLFGKNDISKVYASYLEDHPS